MGFLESIRNIDIEKGDLSKILQIDLVDNSYEVIDTDEFDDANFLRTNKEIITSLEYDGKLKKKVHTLQVGNKTSEYALLKDLFHFLYLEEPQIKNNKTINVTQLLHKEMLGILQQSHSYQYLKEHLKNNNAKSFVTANMLADNIIDYLNTLNEQDYDDVLKDAQSLYESMQGNPQLEKSGEGNSGSGEEGEATNSNSEEEGQKGQNEGEGKNQGSYPTSSSGEEGVSSFDELPQPVKDKLSEIKENLQKAVKGSYEKTEGKIKETEKILETLSFGSNPAKAFIDRKLIEQIKLYEELLDQKKIKQIINILGQIQHRNQERWDNIKTSKQVKLVEITIGDDITNLIPEELFCFSDELLELDLMSRLQERSALIYHGKPKASWKGPIVFCLDESGSMNGIKNIKAKAVALAMIDIALKQGRKFATVHFDSSVSDTYVLERVDKGKSLDMMIEIAGHFSGGGTSYNPPLEKALEIIGQEKYLKNADIIFITDGMGEALKEENYDKIKLLQRDKKIQIINILIGKNQQRYYNKKNIRDLTEVSNENMVIDDLLEAEEEIFNISVR